MEHRPIIGSAKTGTISRSQARGAARFAKTAKKSSAGRGKSSTVGVSSDGHQRSSYFRFLFGPATAEPEGWSDLQGKSAKKNRKRSAKKSAKKSAKRSTAKKSSKLASKSHR
jgi:hypothetical protein